METPVETPKKERKSRILAMPAFLFYVKIKSGFDIISTAFKR